MSVSRYTTLLDSKSKVESNSLNLLAVLPCQIRSSIEEEIFMFEVCTRIEPNFFFLGKSQVKNNFQCIFAWTPVKIIHVYRIIVAKVVLAKITVFDSLQTIPTN